MHLNVIALITMEPDLEECCKKGHFLAIDTSHIPSLAVKQVTLSIPLDLLRSLSIGNDTIQIASSSYKNISQALSFGLQEK